MPAGASSGLPSLVHGPRGTARADSPRSVVFLRRGGADADKAAAAIAASAPAGQRLTAGVLRSAEEVDRVCGAVTSLAARLQADVDATWRRMDVTGRAEAPRLSGHSASAHTLDAAADLVGGSRA